MVCGKETEGERKIFVQSKEEAQRQTGKRNVADDVPVGCKRQEMT